MSFFNLHQHTTYSFLDGYGQPEQYLERLKAIDAKGMALTDHGNIFAHHPFEKAFRGSGQHLVYGCEMYALDELKAERGYYHITVLAKTNAGYKNLLKLVNISSQQFYYKPRITFDQIIDNSEGLIILSGCCCDGWLVKSDKNEEEKWSSWCHSFRNVEWYAEIQPFLDEKEKWDRLTHMAGKYGRPCLVTADAHYPAPEDAKTQDFQLAINTRKAMSDPDRLKFEYPLHLPSTEDILARCKEMGSFNEEWVLDTEKVGLSCQVELPKSEMIKLGGKIGDLRSKCLKRMEEI